jgi:uroporphyrinogen-III synthase
LIQKPLPTIVTSAKLKPVKSILISQPKPELGKSPYIDLAVQFKIKLDWRPFTHVEGVKAADFRKDKVYIEQYSMCNFYQSFCIRTILQNL